MSSGQSGQDPDQQISRYCDAGGLNLSVPDEAGEQQLLRLLQDHLRHTASPLAQRLLDNWSAVSSQFVQVLPEEYRQALQRLEAESQLQEVG